MTALGVMISQGNATIGPRRPWHSSQKHHCRTTTPELFCLKVPLSAHNVNGVVLVFVAVFEAWQANQSAACHTVWEDRVDVGMTVIYSQYFYSNLNTFANMRAL